MFFVDDTTKEETVRVMGIDDAKALIAAFNDIDTFEGGLKKRLSTGSRTNAPVHELSFKGASVRVVGDEDLLLVIRWLLDLGAGEFSCEDIEHEDNELQEL